MPKFRKKPVVIEANRFDPAEEPWHGVFLAEGCPTGYRIHTLEGVHDVTPGDWVITGVKGERYPCKPDIFEMTYDPVSDDE